MQLLQSTGVTPEERPLLSFLKESEVGLMTKICKSQRYAMEKEGRFPARIKLGRASVWLLHEVQAFMASAVEASRGKGPASAQGGSQ